GCAGGRVRHFDDRLKRRKGVELLLAPIDDGACFPFDVARGVIPLEAWKTIRVQLERKARDFEPLPGRRPTRENTHKRGPSPFSSLGRRLPKHFEENRAGGPRLDALCFVITKFSK